MISRVQSLESMGEITGVMDDRGKVTPLPKHPYPVPLHIHSHDQERIDFPVRKYTME